MDCRWNSCTGSVPYTSPYSCGCGGGEDDLGQDFRPLPSMNNHRIVDLWLRFPNLPGENTGFRETLDEVTARMRCRAIGPALHREIPSRADPVSSSGTPCPGAIPFTRATGLAARVPGSPI